MIELNSCVHNLVFLLSCFYFCLFYSYFPLMSTHSLVPTWSLLVPSRAWSHLGPLLDPQLFLPILPPQHSSPLSLVPAWIPLLIIYSLIPSWTLILFTQVYSLFLNSTCCAQAWSLLGSSTILTYLIPRSTHLTQLGPCLDPHAILTLLSPSVQCIQQSQSLFREAIHLTGTIGVIRFSHLHKAILTRRVEMMYPPTPPSLESHIRNDLATRNNIFSYCFHYAEDIRIRPPQQFFI